MAKKRMSRDSEKAMFAKRKTIKVRPKMAFIHAGQVGLRLNPEKTYTAHIASNQPDYLEKGKVFVTERGKKGTRMEMMLEREDYEIVSPREWWDVQSQAWHKDVSPLSYYKEEGWLEVTDASGRVSKVLVRTKEEFEQLKASTPYPVRWLKEPRDYLAEKVAEQTFEGLKSEASKVLLGTPDEYALEGVADKFSTPASVVVFHKSGELQSRDMPVYSSSDFEKLNKMPGVMSVKVVTPPLEVESGDKKGKFWKSPMIVRVVTATPGKATEQIVYSQTELNALSKNPDVEGVRVLVQPTFTRPVIKGRPSLGSLALTGAGEVGKFGLKEGKKVGGFAVKEGKVLGVAAQKEAPKLVHSAAVVGGAAAKESSKIAKAAASGTKNVVGDVFGFFKSKMHKPVSVDSYMSQMESGKRSRSALDNKGVLKLDRMVSKVEEEKKGEGKGDVLGNKGLLRLDALIAESHKDDKVSPLSSSQWKGLDIKKGGLTDYGYNSKESTEKRRKALADAVAYDNAGTVIKRLNLQVVFRKKKSGKAAKARKVFEADREWVHDNFIKK